MSSFLVRRAFCAWVGLVAAAAPAFAASNVVISQVYGGGGNTGSVYKNDFIELFNRGAGPVSLAGWSVQYASAAGTSWQVTNLTGTLQPGQYYLVQEAVGTGGTTNLPTPDATGTIPMGGTAGKVALVNVTTALTGSGCPFGASVVDFVGFGGTASCFEGTGPTPAPSNANAVFRAAGGCTDSDTNSADFAAALAGPRNTAFALNLCGGSGNPSGVGAATPSTLQAGEQTLLTVTVTPGTSPTSTGLAVSADLTSTGGLAATTFFDDATNGDVTAGDLVFSLTAMVAGGTTPGVKSLTAAITDAEARSGSATITLTVEAPVTLTAIHDIQGAGSTSPFVTQTLTTRGIVTGVKTNGFFIQLPDAEADADPATSEGIFVFTSTAPPAAAALGNEVRVTGQVQEFIPSQDLSSPPVTEIGGTPTVVQLSSGNPLPTAVVITAADTDPAGSLEQLERYEGMRASVASLTASAPTQGLVNEPNATSTSTGIFYGVVTGIDRPRREIGIEVPDPLPPGAPCCIPRFDGNPERLRVDSDALGHSPLEVTAGAVVTGLVGPLDYAFRTYMIDLDATATVGVSGNVSARPVQAPTLDAFTVVCFNIERFFDTINDPGIGEPVLTAAAFERRLSKASLAIRQVLKLPDILAVEEVENLTTLQTLATRVNADVVGAGGSSPAYVAYLEEGNDVGGIDVGFLVKSSRVSVVDVVQEGKDATYVNPANGQSELLNDRPSLVLRATVAPPSGAPQPITVIVNHLRSLLGVDDPVDGPRVREKRRAQAEFLANLIQARQLANPAERIVSVGDYNAFEFSDGYVDSLGTIKGTPAAGDTVVAPSSDLVSPDLTDLADLVAPPERYSFSFDGNAQVLDHIVVTSNLLPSVTNIEYARVDADFPESLRGDAARPERLSDHDPAVATFSLALPGTTTTLTASPNPVHVTASVTYTATVSGTSPGPAPTGTVDFKEGGTTVGSGTLAGGIATFTTNYPSAGSHTLTAVYDGDGAYGGSTSSAVTEIVLDTTSTDLVGTPNPVDAGAPVTYTAVVGSPGGMPTGSVDFKEEGVTIATRPLVDGLAIYTTSYASAGTHTLTAVYPGDATHEGSTSLPFPEKVRNTTTVSLLGSPNPVLGGSFVTYTATVTSPQGGTPSGTVDFTEGGTTVGSGTLAGGVATFTTGYISASSHTLIATYDGDPTFSGSTSSPFTETVINGTFTYLASSRNPIAIGSPVTYTATVESFGTPTGVVTFKEGSSTLGSVALSGGVATLTTSYDAAGVHVITAEYGGAVTYAASTSAPLTQEVVAIGLLANDAGIFEGNLGRRTFSMTVSLNAPSTLPVSVHYQTQSASARAGSDYLDVRGTLVFAPGQTSKTVTTSVIGDRLRERNEVFLLVLSAATNATLVRSRGMETILNDD